MATFSRFCLLLLSLSGSAWYLTRRFHIRPEFAPALVCSTISTILFLAGCVNLLPETALLLFASGLLLPAFSLYKSHKQQNLHNAFDKRLLFLFFLFLCTVLYFFLFLQHAHITSYDNFSHWATVVKDLLRENRMPNFQDAVIRFQSYPLGSSLWIYYVCRILGMTDGCMLWAQLLMQLSLLFCMSAFVHKRNAYCGLALLLFCIWGCSANNSIYELRVDTLLAAAGIAAFAVFYAYRNDPGKALYSCCSILILLIQIKNSGVFFYCICLVFLAVYAGKPCRQGIRCFAGVGLFVPLFTMYLWKKHVAFAFADGMDSKHSMNIAHFGEMAAKKSREDVLSIGKSILQRFLEFDHIEVKLLVGLTVFLLLFAALFLFVFHNRGYAARMLLLLAADLSCAAAYTVSLYAMYVFSMPMGESAHLASYDRYMLSVLVFLYGITVIVVMDTLHSVKTFPTAFASYTAAACFVCAAFLLVLQVKARIPLLYQSPDFTRTKRFQLQSLLREHEISEGDSCVLYCNGSDDDKRYLFYLTRYELWTGKVLVVRGEELTEQELKLADYEHLIVWDWDERIGAFLDGSEQSSNMKIILRQ